MWTYLLGGQPPHCFSSGPSPSSLFSTQQPKGSSHPLPHPDSEGLSFLPWPTRTYRSGLVSLPLDLSSSAILHGGSTPATLTSYSLSVNACSFWTQGLCPYGSLLPEWFLLSFHLQDNSQGWGDGLSCFSPPHPLLMSFWFLSQLYRFHFPCLCCFLQ